MPSFTEDGYYALPFTQDVACAISKTDLCVIQEKNTENNTLGKYFIDCSTLNSLLSHFHNITTALPQNPNTYFFPAEKQMSHSLA